MIENKITPREDCLLKAVGKVIGKDIDSEDYGKPEFNLANIANLWSAYLSNKYCFYDSEEMGVKITPDEVAQMMALFKIGRIQGNYSVQDSYIDACGYLACGYECQCGEDDEE